MIKIDIRSTKPIYEQLVEQIKEAVLKGYLKKGDAFFSVRKLAAMLEVNPNTVLKAYNELERQGVIVTLRGKGTFIGEGFNENDEKQKAESIKKLKTVVIEMSYLGMSTEDILNEVKKIKKELKEDKLHD